MFAVWAECVAVAAAPNALLLLLLLRSACASFAAAVGCGFRGMQSAREDCSDERGDNPADKQEIALNTEPAATSSDGFTRTLARHCTRVGLDWAALGAQKIKK